MLRVRKSVIRNSQYTHTQDCLACHNIFIVGYLFSGNLKERKRPILERTLPDSVRCKSSQVTFPTRICGYSRPNTTDIRDNNGNSVSSLRGTLHGIRIRTCIPAKWSKVQPAHCLRVHRELASLASLEMKITSYIFRRRPRGVRSLSRNRSRVPTCYDCSQEPGHYNVKRFGRDPC